jgi:hypothetical protein
MFYEQKNTKSFLFKKILELQKILIYKFQEVFFAKLKDCMLQSFLVMFFHRFFTYFLPKNFIAVFDLKDFVTPIFASEKISFETLLQQKLIFPTKISTFYTQISSIIITILQQTQTHIQ